MHPRNRHRSRYDLKQLIKSCPQLVSHVLINKFGDETIDFSNPESVKLLNQAILKDFYKITWWDIPPDYLCPPIPGRADYLHYVADLLALTQGQIPKGKLVRGLDVGVGANCVYPLIGQYEYGWSFIGSDIDKGAIESAQLILDKNSGLKEQVELRLQVSPAHIFQGILKSDELIDFSLCNPPFHASAEEAALGTERKLKNLGLKKSILNFGGKGHELWCPGGEKEFVKEMIEESSTISQQCLWFTTLISKKENLPDLERLLKKVKALEIKILEMSQGQKISRILAWSFYSKEQQKEWARKRWI